MRGARPIAPAPADSSAKVNPVLSRQTEFDCHQCGLACHSWANLEKHLQAHEEADVPGDSNSDNMDNSTFQKVKERIHSCKSLRISQILIFDAKLCK